MAQVEEGNLFIELLHGPATIYFDQRYDKDTLQATLNENIEQLKTKYKQT